MQCDILQTPPFQAFLADLEALGVTLVEEGGRAYVVIAARSNLRFWLLPLDNARVATAGLEMLQPVNHTAKAAKFVASAMAKLGFYRFLGKRQFRFLILPDFSHAFGLQSTHVAYFTGTDGPHRKTSMQVMDINGVILGYVKLSRKNYIRPYLRNEAEMLERVRALDIESADIPRVLALYDNIDFTLLVTDSCKSADVNSPLQLKALHLKWLEDLRKSTIQVGAGPLLEDLASRLSIIKSVVDDTWVCRITRALSVLHPDEGKIPLCLVHGDFTPWNSFVKNDRLYVFDWEYSNLAWPVGFDLVHFLLATTPREKQLKDLPRILKSLASAHFDYKEGAARRALILSLVCHAVFHLSRLVEAQSVLKGWCDGAMRASLIDLLLDAEEFNT